MTAPSDGLTFTVSLLNKHYRVVFDAQIGDFYPVSQDTYNELTGHELSALSRLGWEAFREME